MDPSPCSGPPSTPTASSRRDFLWGFGGERLLAAGGADGVVPRSCGIHHPAKAKRVIQLFMNGGMSPQDTFDYKPRLVELHGKPFDPGNGRRVESVTGSH